MEVLLLLVGVLFVLRGVLQGIGRVLVPTITGVIELVMRVVAALALGGLWEFTGVALSNPLAWLGAIVLLIPAYIVAHRQFAKMTVDPVEPTLTTPITTITTPIPVVGPSEGSHTVDAVFTAPVPIARPRLTKVRMSRVGRRRKD